MNVGIRPQTSLIAAICNKSGVDLDAISLSKTTVHRKRYKQIEDFGDKIRDNGYIERKTSMFTF